MSYVRPLAGLNRSNLVTELTGGVTLLAIAVPLNIGYSQIAGLPPTAGLYALILPGIVYALTVGSRQLVASVDAAAAALVASSIGAFAASGTNNYAAMALAQALILGVLMIAAGIFKLGFLANFLSKPILVGFVGGLALDILLSQVAKMLGVKIGSGGEFTEKLKDLVTNLDKISGWSVVMSVIGVVILVGGKRLSRLVPWALIVLVGGMVAVKLFDLKSHGVSVLGTVKGGAPTLTWPHLGFSQWLALVPSAIALAMVTMAEGLLVARSYAEKNGYPDAPNQDLKAFGFASLAAGVTGGFAVGTSTSRTAALDQTGSRTQLPSLVTAVGTLALVIFGTAVLADIPNPAIGAIVGVAVVPLLGIADFRVLWRQDRMEFVVGAVCFAVTLFVGAIAGIVVAFVLALINLASRAAHPAIDVLADDDNPHHSLLGAEPPGGETAPGVVVIRLAAPLFFANSTVFADAVKAAVDGAEGGVQHVVLDLEAVTDVDVTAAETFESLKEWLDDRQVTLGFSRVRQPAIDRMRELGVYNEETIYPTNREALAELSPRG